MVIAFIGKTPNPICSKSSAEATEFKIIITNIPNAIMDESRIYRLFCRKNFLSSYTNKFFISFSHPFKEKPFDFRFLFRYPENFHAACYKRVIDFCRSRNRSVDDQNVIRQLYSERGKRLV